MSAKRFVVFFGVLALVGSGAARLSANTATATLAVSATVSPNCSVTGGTLAFGSYSPISAANTDQTGTVQVTCAKGTTATVGLDAGANASGSTRQMSNGSDQLAYELYKDSSRTSVWGNSGSEQLSLAAATSNAAQPLTVYGRIAGSQNVGLGAYSDTVTVTVTF